jgi:hypothetical protein
MPARAALFCVLGLVCLPAVAFAAPAPGTETLTTTMLGSNEVPKGPPNGSGRGFLQPA